MKPDDPHEPTDDQNNDESPEDETDGTEIHEVVSDFGDVRLVSSFETVEDDDGNISISITGPNFLFPETQQDDEPQDDHEGDEEEPDEQE